MQKKKIPFTIIFHSKLGILGDTSKAEHLPKSGRLVTLLLTEYNASARICSQSSKLCKYLSKTIKDVSSQIIIPA